MDDNRLRVLEMVRDGKIGVEEAERVLAALEQSPEGAGEASGPVPAQGGAAAPIMRIRVYDGTDRKVNVNIPVSIAKVFWRLVPKDAFDNLSQQELDIDSILAAVRDGARGKLVDVADDTGKRVEITIE